MTRSLRLTLGLVSHEEKRCEHVQSGWLGESRCAGLPVSKESSKLRPSRDETEAIPQPSRACCSLSLRNPTPPPLLRHLSLIAPFSLLHIAVFRSAQLLLGPPILLDLRDHGPLGCYARGISLLSAFRDLSFIVGLSVFCPSQHGHQQTAVAG